MKVLPQLSDYRNWMKFVPINGDVVFFRTATQAQSFKGLGFPIYTVDEAMAQVIDLLGLNERSWYGYSLSKSAGCMKLPVGGIESLPMELQKKIFEIQLSLRVPTIVRTQKAKGYFWITSDSWKKQSNEDRLALLKAYYEQHTLIEKYDSIEFQKLPHTSREVVEDLNLEKLVNTFPKRSGPNCFAAVAQAISGQELFVGDVWLHWGPLSQFLKDQGYGVRQTSEMNAGNVLILHKDRKAIHGGVYLGNDLIFEKPGQDFYEPYIVSNLKKMKSDWPGAKVEIWRKLQ